MDGVEQSVIDFVIMSSDLINHVEYMHIDDKRENVLTKLTKSKKGKQRHTKKVESDHNEMETKINIPWNVSMDEPVEVYNLKDPESKKSF